ncbi:uncharacterized protein LOC131236870 [Magnolia sinica]|uniref:uncharacterized protein LOC131236870 n=1 Tax=Magnolia sinica TaxID=86752 RepID=UPI00265AC42D|nr:uncharacterized protein LOC131236870 [Magnolia sinica]
MDRTGSSIGKQFSPQEWETLIDDFQLGGRRRERWLSQSPGPALVELALLSVLRKDTLLPLKFHLIVFVEENADLLVEDPTAATDALDRVLDAVRTIVQSPVDNLSVTYALKEQMMVSATSVMILIDSLEKSVVHLEGLTELLLTVINRPNHGVDRQTRAVACECLRELENTYPCLLSEITGHLWNLCQGERTHASQSYLLLLTSVIHNIVRSTAMNSSILTTSVPLVPFNVPHFLTAGGEGATSRELSSLNMKELRRVTAFLLERPRNLTPWGMLEFMQMLVGIAGTLELQASLLKVHISGLLYSYDPILCHVVLMLYSRLSDAFDGEESEIARRLTLLSKEVQQHLVFRLLALHWLLGFRPMKKGSIVPMAPSFYPMVFDPLALKAVKLDLLAYCAVCIDSSGTEGVSGGDGGGDVTVVKLFEDGLVCVSAFKWLPPWSTETIVAFRMLHKFLTGATPHSGSDDSSVGVGIETTIFLTLQTMFVNMALEFCRLVPVIVAFIDRLLSCSSHCWLGERLLHTFDERLLPKLATDYCLASYFPIFDRIAENETIPPHGLLELLTAFVVVLVEKHGPDTWLKSWSQGSKVLGICRTMLMHHHSSRVFLLLSRLLAFTCQCFPDLEVRDNARIYLRMLVCVPGKKLRHILNLGDQLPGVSPSPHLASFFQAQSPRPSQDLGKSRDISSYIHLERVNPLLVKQSWSLAIPTLGIENNKSNYFEGIGDSGPPIDIEKEGEGSSDVQILSETDRIGLPQEPLRVMDSKVAEILGILRRHFTCIPDFRHVPGLKIKIPCTLRFESEPFNRIWGVDSSATPSSDVVDELPALYATVIIFSSSAAYGSIPSFRIPFLLGEPSRNDYDTGQKSCLDIVPIENGSEQEEGFRAPVMIELEPREPMPGLVSVAIEANAENGQTISGPLQSITVGIEDMFLRASIPSDITEDLVPEYYSDLFHALWEACSNSANTGRETFPLKGGKGVAAISGTSSVKLLEVPLDTLIRSVERYLAPFVVSVIGQPLVDIVKDDGVIEGVVWKDDSVDCARDDATSSPYSSGIPLQLKYIQDEVEEDDADSSFDIRNRNMGCFLILIFLPPRFHLLFQMEVSDISTLVRIRTDHWPCLAYIDDYLEAAFLT